MNETDELYDRIHELAETTKEDTILDMQKEIKRHCAKQTENIIRHTQRCPEQEQQSVGQ